MDFHEKQSFWNWLLVILMMILFISTLDFDWEAVLKGNLKEIGINPSFWIILTITVLFSLVRLRTTIDRNGITVQFFPFLLKSKLIKWSELEQIYVKDYNPIADYGGWGYRNGGEGKAYNTKGTQGLQLIFKDGSRLLIGTQKKKELGSIVNKVNQEIFLK